MPLQDCSGLTASSWWKEEQCFEYKAKDSQLFVNEKKKEEKELGYYTERLKRESCLCIQ